MEIEDTDRRRNGDWGEIHRERWKKSKFYHYYTVLSFVNRIVQSLIISIYIQFINICQFYKIQNMSYTKKTYVFKT